MKYTKWMIVSVMSLLMTWAAPSWAQGVEKKIKVEIQKQLGDRAKVESVATTPITGLYEVTIGKDVVYTDASGRYLVQGEIIDLKTGTNLTDTRAQELNKIRWQDLPLQDAVKVVRGKGTRQMAVFADPNCGYCKKLEKSLQQLDNVTIHTFLVAMLSADSLTKSQSIWCSSDRGRTWLDWMINNQLPTGKADCATPLDRNMALAKKYQVTGTPAMFFEDGSRLTGAVSLAQIEKRLKP